MAGETYDRTTQDVSNIVALEHVNVWIPISRSPPCSLPPSPVAVTSHCLQSGRSRPLGSGQIICFLGSRRMKKPCGQRHPLETPTPALLA
jgi:hypothetical protein